MDRKIGIIGGDLRIIRLAEMLSREGYIIYTFALNEYNFLEKNILKCNKINEINDSCDYIIGGIPFSKDGLYINTSFFDSKLSMEKILENIKDKTLIAGGIKQEIRQKLLKNSVKAIDLLDYEELCVLNTIPTVEGAIQIAMEQTEFTIHGSNCLILGFGRIGKLLTSNLKKLGANVSCMARNESDIAWIRAFGYNDIHISDLKENLQNKYDIIFNTIPILILDKEKLEFIKDKKTIIIELASNPGGIDLEKAKELEIKVIKALGLPGNVAPLTAARYIKEILNKIIK